MELYKIVNELLPYIEELLNNGVDQAEAEAQVLETLQEILIELRIKRDGYIVL